MEETKHLVFVSTLYGAYYLPFLAPHLHSLTRHNPDAEVLFLWQDLPVHEIRLLAMAYPKLFPVQSFQEMAEDSISMKLRFWRQACALRPESTLCFLDSDILAARSIKPLLAGDWDLTVTWKDELWPINTGVLMVKNARKTEPLINEWWLRTEKLLADKLTLGKACFLSGGGDQHSLRELIGFVNYEGTHQKKLGDLSFLCRGIPCSQLNQTECSPITDDTYLIHYKGLWHEILLKGAEFSEKRPRKKCQEMYELWLGESKAAKRFIPESVLRYVLARQPQTGTSHLQNGLLAARGLVQALDCGMLIETGLEEKEAAEFSIALGDKCDLISIRPRCESGKKQDTRYLMEGSSFQIIPTILRKLPEDSKEAFLLCSSKDHDSFALATGLLREFGSKIAGIIFTEISGEQKKRFLQICPRACFSDEFADALPQFSNGSAFALGLPEPQQKHEQS